MNNEATLVYPHQLFKRHPALKKGRRVYLIEEPLFFKQYSFHKKKIVFHRASMKFYEDDLKKKGFDVTYIETEQVEKTSAISATLKRDQISKVFYAELDDHWLEKRLNKAFNKSEITNESMPSPAFLSDLKWSKDFFSSKKDYFQTSFYIAQRKRLKILVNNNKPIGGSWTFDKENRKKLPKSHKPPAISWPKKNNFVRNAKVYCEQHFQNNPGNLDGISYPTTHTEALDWLEIFIEQRLNLFGDYQDAISNNNSFLYHSLLSSSLNSGLITPEEVIDKVLAAHQKKTIPLNSLEGFIRQIIGWREYFRAIYNLESVNQRNTNFFGYSRKIPNSFWTGETGIEPIDITIKQVLNHAYAHHIERLMILGNFMLLCEFDPDEVYRWFMELFIDAYDWVMVPNVYGMSQFADGGLITTKPYVSSSNYIRKMSNFNSGEWSNVWDGLYWNFIDENKELFASNRRMGLMLKQLENMDKEKLNMHKKNAGDFLKSIE